MATRRWIHSLRFRLILGFAAILALALSAVSAYTTFAAQREIERFAQQAEKARAGRVEQMLAQAYAVRRDWRDVRPVVQQASDLYGRRITITDVQGNVVFDSHPFVRTDPRAPREGQPPIGLPIRTGGRTVGELTITPSDPQINPVEPSISNLVAGVRRSLLLTGIAAGVGSILLIAFFSRQFLAPIGALSMAARRLGQGDLSQRAPVAGDSEVGELGRSFNSMAEALQQADQQRRSLMADVAHELRTPLSNIRGYLEAIKDDVVKPDPATIDILYQEVLHLTHLVEDLRLLALAEAGSLRLDKQMDDVLDVARRSVEAIRPRTEAKHITLALETPPVLPLASIDRQRIMQVLGNLLENALTHTPEGGRIVVAAALKGSVIQVAVKDTGPGIPAAEIERIFERFYRLDPSRARATGGAGLGLTIARQLVEAHGGRIWAESGQGNGATFIFELPVAADA